MSIKSEIDKYTGKAKLRFHTPGHKGLLCNDDITEINDSNLFPADCITKAQNDAAAFYGAKYIRFLTNGSSTGVKAAIYAVGCDILCWAYSHKSVFLGAKLSGHKCVTVGNSPIYPPDAREVAQAIALMPNVGAVVITSPTYYGVCADLQGIRSVCDMAGVRLIVDGAHGAHFCGKYGLPENPCKIADICNLSAHKTLKALTPAALIAVNAIDLLDRVDGALELLQTTSPPYNVLSSIEYGINQLKTDGDKYLQLKTAVDIFKSRLPCLCNDDYTRLVLDCDKLGISSDYLNEELNKQGIFSEMQTKSHIVFILTAADSASDIDSLAQAILKISSGK